MGAKRVRKTKVPVEMVAILDRVSRKALLEKRILNRHLKYMRELATKKTFWQKALQVEGIASAKALS